MSYFVWNKELDFLRGYSDNTVYFQGSLRLKNPFEGGEGIYVSRIMDAGEGRILWRRLEADFEIRENQQIWITIYSADESPSLEEARKRFEERGMAGLLAFFRPFACVEGELERYMPLYEAKGRCLWFSAALRGLGGGPGLSSLAFYFGGRSWTQYLPELYQNLPGAVLERYLEIFQGIYEETERKIREAPALLTIEKTDRIYLEWLADWLGIQEVSAWKTENLRRYLPEAAEISLLLGTREGLKRLTELYLGESVYIEESWEEPRVTVAVRAEAVPDSKAHQALLQIVKRGCPAGVRAEIVLLHPYTFLGKTSYLGINTVLTPCREGILDQNAFIPAATVGSRKEEEKRDGENSLDAFYQEPVF